VFPLLARFQLVQLFKPRINERFGIWVIALGFDVPEQEGDFIGEFVVEFKEFAFILEVARFDKGFGNGRTMFAGSEGCGHFGFLYFFTGY
jgi:hypothetical protein